MKLLSQERKEHCYSNRKTSSDNEVGLNNQYDCKYRTQYLEQYILSILIDKSISRVQYVLIIDIP